MSNKKFSCNQVFRLEFPRRTVQIEKMANDDVVILKNKEFIFAITQVRDSESKTFDDQVALNDADLNFDLDLNFEQ